jgi:hypothetical protein
MAKIMPPDQEGGGHCLLVTLANMKLHWIVSVFTRPGIINANRKLW